MGKICCASSALFIGTLVTAPAIAQNKVEKEGIAKSFTTQSQRILPLSGTALDPQKSGYFRVTTTPSNLVDENVCPPKTKAARKALANLEASIWTWILKNKRNWTATAQLIYFDNGQAFQPDEPVVDAEFRFFSVVQEGENVEKCRIEKGFVSTFESPLLLLEDVGGRPPEVAVQVALRYSKKAGEAQVERMQGAAESLLGFFGVTKLIVDRLVPRAKSEFLKAATKDQVTKTVISIKPHSAADLGAIAYLGLRAPHAETKTSETQVKFLAKAVSSMFSQGSAEYTSLASLSPEDVLEFPIAVPKSVDASRKKKLETFLAEDGSYGKMVNAGEVATLSAHCETLDDYLRDKMSFSRVDRAVVLHAIVKRQAKRKDTASVPCLADRAADLQKVSITLAKALPDGIPAAKTRMNETMKAFATLSVTYPENLNDNQFGIFRFPLTIVDPSNEFKWPGQQRKFAASETGALYTFLNSNVESIGCWAFFETAPMEFGLGLSGVESIEGNPVRKSASLVQLKGEARKAMIVQYRYEPDGGPSKVSGIAFVPEDPEAKVRMQENKDCSKADRAWMQDYLKK